MSLDLLPLLWKDHPADPLIRPPFPEWIIGDPAVVLPEDSPDRRWHLFAWGVVVGIHHYVSDDGIRWDRRGRAVRGLRPFVLKEDGVFHLFYEHMVGPIHTRIERVSSNDLEQWSRPEVVLEPTLPWEGHFFRAAGNPCVVRRDGQYWLYYSAGAVWLKDCGFIEPWNIGVARSKSLGGPWVKHQQPLIEPSYSVPHRNHGAGALKVFPDPVSGRLLGFNNGIFIDAEARSRSDIRLLLSDDGLSWSEAWDRPLVQPEPGWKNALVYALDVHAVGDELWMYYNARDGWAIGQERIGLAICSKRGPA